MQRTKPSKTLLTLLVAGLAFAASPAAFAETQSLSAKIDGKVFESDDPGILYLMPTKSTLNLIAGTKGGSAYPPPKTLSDRLSFKCSNFDGKPRKWTAKEFSSSGCEVGFIKGQSRKPFGDPEAEYRATGDGNYFEVTSVKGKVIEGKFNLELTEVKTKAKIKITDGVFKAEDRQL